MVLSDTKAFPVIAEEETMALLLTDSKAFPVIVVEETTALLLRAMKDMQTTTIVVEEDTSTTTEIETEIASTIAMTTVTVIVIEGASEALEEIGRTGVETTTGDQKPVEEQMKCVTLQIHQLVST